MTYFPFFFLLVRWSGVLLAAAVGASSLLQADVIETIGGSVIQGRVIASEGGLIKVDTDFAGTIAIKQDQVKSLTTDAPIHVALADGHVVNGKIETGGSGLRVRSATASLTTTPTAITALWRDGDKSPAEKAADALRRKWGRELAFDLNGRKGNSDRTFVGISGRAVLQGAADRLMFFGNYSRAKENDATTQDEAKAGVDFSSFFSEKMSWYVRTELGYDRTKDLDLRSQSAGGVGFTFIKKSDQMLEGRVGLSYRLEEYRVSEDFDALGIDLGILHSLSMSWGRLSNSLSITPSFEDIGNFVLVQDSAIELPVSGKPWRLRVGVKSDYSSEPPAGLDKLDWTYYTQLVLSWK